jgi:hypothetical protein
LRRGAGSGPIAGEKAVGVGQVLSWQYPIVRPNDHAMLADHALGGLLWTA